jgi:hypothetical protein
MTSNCEILPFNRNKKEVKNIYILNTEWRKYHTCHQNESNFLTYQFSQNDASKRR